MLDRIARRQIDPWMAPLAGWLATKGTSANWVTGIGVILGLLGCVAIAFQWTWTGLILIGGNRFCDGLDGMVARRTGATDLGGFLDSVADTLFYAAVPFCFGVSRPENQLAASALLLSFFGTSGSFLAYAILAAKRGLEGGREQRKSFFYSVGLMEGTETIVFFALFCVFPGHFNELAWTFSGLCWMTTVHRVLAGVREFSGR